MWGSQEKNLGKKVNVKFFRVDPYTLGNRIPLAFQNLSDLHIYVKVSNQASFCVKKIILAIML